MLTASQFTNIRTVKGMLSGYLHGAFWRVLTPGNPSHGLDAFVPQTWDELNRHLRPYRERSIIAVSWRWAIPVPPGGRRGSFRALCVPWPEAVQSVQRGGGAVMRFRLLAAAHLLFERTEKWRHGRKP